MSLKPIWPLRWEVFLVVMNATSASAQPNDLPRANVSLDREYLNYWNIKLRLEAMNDFAPIHMNESNASRRAFLNVSTIALSNMTWASNPIGLWPFLIHTDTFVRIKPCLFN